MVTKILVVQLEEGRWGQLLLGLLAHWLLALEIRGTRRREHGTGTLQTGQAEYQEPPEQRHVPVSRTGRVSAYLTLKDRAVDRYPWAP